MLGLGVLWPLSLLVLPYRRRLEYWVCGLPLRLPLKPRPRSPPCVDAVEGESGWSPARVFGRGPCRRVSEPPRASLRYNLCARASRPRPRSPAGRP
ncbi:hypothetical protein B0T19DRAFT_425589 [Cercophora scortea]|uniref:Secreted protein n=1 Tax=Cercophora scortea TaxID=314031 RepID=A0AAE0IFF5_9PEZI|nr:hypothetical protein B0T19DRAFT_425589 [Cercophora scortea]